MNTKPPSGRPGDLEAIIRYEAPESAFVPLEHKLRPPGRRRGVVSRGALIERLGADDTDIVAVTAPPGYGKTTMLAEWVSSDERRCAWLSLDARDNDPVVLLTYVAAALDKIERVDAGFVPAL